MGLTIHYSGRMANKQKLPLLIEELEEISNVRGWKYHIFEPRFPPGVCPDDENDGYLYGMCMNPPDCEPVVFSFTNNGRLCGPGQFSVWADSTDETEKKYLYLNSTKTQFAGPETHKMIIGIFRYVASHYLTDFTMHDEAGFWETGDEKLLIQNFRKNSELINMLKEKIEANIPCEDEDVETYLERIIRKFRDKRSESDTL